jgi:hypothetical protein
LENSVQVMRCGELSEYLWLDGALVPLSDANNIDIPEHWGTSRMSHTKPFESCRWLAWHRTDIRMIALVEFVNSNGRR